MSDAPNLLKMYTSLDSEAHDFQIEGLIGEEKMDLGFLYHLTFSAAKEDLDGSLLLNKKITLSIAMPSGELRYINGFVVYFNQGPTGGGSGTYHLRIMDWFQKLRRTNHRRIFHRMTVQEIATQIFQEHQLPDFEFDIRRAVKPRETCTCYDESWYYFIQRIFQEEGWTYYYQMSQETHKMIITDFTKSWPQCPGLESEVFLPEANTDWGGEQLLESCSLVQVENPQSIVTGDYDPTRANTSLFTEKPIDPSQTTPLQIYTYPAGTPDSQEIDQMLDRQVQGVKNRSLALVGSSWIRSFTAGHQFEVINHQNPKFNGKWVLNTVEIEASDNSYHNTFHAYPVDIPLPSEKKIVKPRINHAQTAVVVTPQDRDEVYTNALGCVWVRYHWSPSLDGDQGRSSWVRVLQGTGGLGGFGMQFLPRKGAEVIVNFIEGDPDRPYIQGTLWNSITPPPYPLPQNKHTSAFKSLTVGGKKGHELKFVDVKDKEEVYLRSQKDLTIEVENQELTLIKKSRQTFIQEKEAQIDKTVADHLVVNGNRRITIKKEDSLEEHYNEGNFTHAVAKNHEQTVEENFTQNVTKNFVLTVKGDSLTIEAAGDGKGAINIIGKSISLESTEGNIQIKAAKDFSTTMQKMTTKAEKSVTILSGTNFITKSEKAMSLISGKVAVQSKGMEFKADDQITMKGGKVSVN